MAMDAWYKALPPVTRTYVTLCFLTTAACALELITPFHLYFNPRLIASPSGWEPWRLVTPFLYYGPLGLDWLFHMFFLVKYSSALESGSFRGRASDFAWMLGLCGAALLGAAPLARAQFLGAPLAFALVYVWARRHPAVLMSFLGVLTFTAPWLPWVLLGVSVLLRGSATVDLLGMAVGHCYYFLEDVYPRMSAGRRPLAAPRWLRALFGEGGASRGGRPAGVGQRLGGGRPAVAGVGMGVDAAAIGGGGG